MVFVTGATGLVGAQITLDLLRSGKKVKALRRPSSDLTVIKRIFSGYDDLLQQIQWVEGDINDYLSITEALDGVNEVVHAAGLISFHRSDAELMQKINAEGTANVVNACLDRKIKSFAYISSVAAIGRSAGNSHIDENCVWKTSKENSDYAISKYGGEREVWRGIEEGLPAFIVNPSIVLGPGDPAKGSTRLFLEVYNGLKFYSTGTTGFVDVRDVSCAVLQLMEKGITGERFILSSENLPYQKVFQYIAKALNKPEPSIKASGIVLELAWRLFAIGRMFGVKSLVTRQTALNSKMNWYYNNSKIKNELGMDFIKIEDSIKYVSEKIFGAVSN